MTDRDRDLQDAFDRHLRGEGPPPDTENDPEAAAYEAVYAALGEAPAGDLPDGFATDVADRVGLARDPGMGWAEILLLLLIIAGAGAGLVWMPPTLAGVQQPLGEFAALFQDLSRTVRLDIILASVLVLLLTTGLDAFFKRLRPGHPPMSP
jgi:hypothetical protein